LKSLSDTGKRLYNSSNMMAINAHIKTQGLPISVLHPLEVAFLGVV
jgi:hypothetical protein